MLQPKRTKYRKAFRGHLKGVATNGNTVLFGEFGLKALAGDWITARIAINRHLRRGGQIWVRVFPDKPISKKAAETRMGGGKSAVDHWVAVVKPGRILFEVAGIPQKDAAEALRLASHKLPIATKSVSRDQAAAMSAGAG
jgi:large subunit ribosomal protein L16